MRATRMGVGYAMGAAILTAICLSAPSSEGQPLGGRGRICDGKSFVCLDQGWADHERSWWYTISQGSRLLPLNWFLALEQPAATNKILAPANLEKHRYLANAVSRENPHGLPLGFVVDKEEATWTRIMCDVFGMMCARETLREPWVGLNCSACHTSQIIHRGTAIRIEGAPTMADFQGFNEELLQSLRATLAQPEKFARFAGEVLKEVPAGQANQRRADLRKELDEQIAWMSRLEAKNGTSFRFGHGRLDAQGHILNKVSLVVGATHQLTDFPSDAPASYPFIWNAPQHDKVQWNGIAENTFRFSIFGQAHDLGALVRNTAEVIGVFAHIDVSASSDTTGYASSLRLSKMIDIERQLGRLQSPRWPEQILGPIDRGKAAVGQQLFEQRCAGCHAPLASADTETPIKAQMQSLRSLGTDIWTACNTYLHKSRAGRLEGRRQFIYAGDPIKDVDYTRAMLGHVAIGAIVGRADELVGKIIDDTISLGQSSPALYGLPTTAYLPGVDDPVKKARAQECLEASNTLLAYKARPLNGIWATAPYLHNGSVPTLYDLLLPASVRTTEPPLAGEGSAAAGQARRPESFHVGSREFDAQKVGIRSVAGAGTSEFRVKNSNGAPILGNYNSGHEGAVYGADTLTDEQRMAIVEYLKTL